MTVLLKILSSGRSVVSNQIKHSLREDTVTLIDNSHDTKDLNNSVCNSKKQVPLCKHCGKATRGNLREKEVPKRSLCISTSVLPTGKLRNQLRDPLQEPLD